MDNPLEHYKPAEKLQLKTIKQDSPKPFTMVSCPSCSSEIEANNIDLPSKTAKCNNCNAIFSVEQEIASFQTPSEMKQEILRPEGIDLFYFKDDLDITVQKNMASALDLAGIMFFPFLSAIFIALFFQNVVPFFITVIFTLAALYFIYRAFVYRKDKIHIDINDRHITIKNRPKNLIKDKVFDTDSVDQLYIKTVAHYNKIYMITNGPSGQRHEQLITVNSLAKAKYLEQEIERHLGIEDRKVPGEIV